MRTLRSAGRAAHARRELFGVAEHAVYGQRQRLNLVEKRKQPAVLDRVLRLITRKKVARRSIARCLVCGRFLVSARQRLRA